MASARQLQGTPGVPNAHTFWQGRSLQRGVRGVQWGAGGVGLPTGGPAGLAGGLHVAAWPLCPCDTSLKDGECHRHGRAQMPGGLPAAL